jgi:hypothetical protein
VPSINGGHQLWELLSHTPSDGASPANRGAWTDQRIRSRRDVIGATTARPRSRVRTGRSGLRDPGHRECCRLRCAQLADLIHAVIQSGFLPSNARRPRLGVVRTRVRGFGSSGCGHLSGAWRMLIPRGQHGGLKSGVGLVVLSLRKWRPAPTTGAGRSLVNDDPGVTSRSKQRQCWCGRPVCGRCSEGRPRFGIATLSLLSGVAI